MSDPLALYIHWPYCLSKCPYCDFNSHIAETIDHARWRKAYARELAHIAALTPDRHITSIYFGGGTPSLMEPGTVDHVLKLIRGHWPLANDIEITLEANPTSVEQERFQAYRDAGVERVSLGVQSLRDEALSFLGRTHSAENAREALRVARSVFDRVSFDLIYARPHQSEKEWEEELKEALELAEAGHLSLYQLTIEPGTAFETMYRRNAFTMPDDEHGGALYELTHQITRDLGFDDYEISNYARPGQKSRHNLAYWRYRDYAGVGPGAHGRLTLNGTKYATRAHRAPAIWLDQVDKHDHGYHPFEAIEGHMRVTECLMMGLRLKEELPFSRLEAEHANWQEVIDQSGMDKLRDAGYVERSPHGLRATAEGRQRLNTVLGHLII